MTFRRTYLAHTDRMPRLVGLAALLICGAAAPSDAQMLVHRFAPAADAASAESSATPTSRVGLLARDHPRVIPTEALIGAGIGAGAALIVALKSIAGQTRHAEGPPPEIILAIYVPIGAAAGALVGYAVAIARGNAEPATLPPVTRQ